MSYDEQISKMKDMLDELENCYRKKEYDDCLDLIYELNAMLISAKNSYDRPVREGRMDFVDQESSSDDDDESEVDRAVTTNLESFHFAFERNDFDKADQNLNKVKAIIIGKRGREKKMLRDA